VRRVQYRIRDGFAVKGDPVVIGRHLEQIRDADGALAPEAVLRDAEREESPLHPCFEWDDTEAARRYRLEQARYLIRAIEVEYETRGPDQATVVAVQYVTLGGRNQTEPYQDIRTVMGDAAKRARYVAAVLRDLQAIREKHRHLRELAEVYAAIDQAAQRLLR
jgi:hypothetical protein